MKSYATLITTVETTGQLSYWAGPIIKGRSFEDAQERLNKIGKGYCKVLYEIVYEEPDYTKNLSMLDLISLKNFSSQKIEC